MARLKLVRWPESSPSASFRVESHMSPSMLLMHLAGNARGAMPATRQAVLLPTLTRRKKARAPTAAVAVATLRSMAPVLGVLLNSAKI